MADHLYVITLDGGPGHKEWAKWKRSMTSLGAKSGDFAGVQNYGVIKHHMDAQTVHALATEKMRKEEDVEVEEIKTETLEGRHRHLHDLVHSYFRPYGEFPNISD